MRLSVRLVRVVILAVAVLAVAVLAFAVPAGATPTREDAARGTTRVVRMPPRLDLSAGARAGKTFAGPYTVWQWPDAAYSDFDERLTIGAKTTPDAHLFWAHQFGFLNADDPAAGGYLGLQEGSYPSNTKIALFSIWSATAAKGGDCGTFVEGTPGYTCRIDPFGWIPGRTYELEVQQGVISARGTWYEATLLDTVTGKRSTVGQIRVPASWGALIPTVSWTEDFAVPSPLKRCSDLPRSRALWMYPMAMHGSVAITGHTNQVGDADCQAKIKNVSGGVVQNLRF
jgi:hypothetical protein